MTKVETLIQEVEDVPDLVIDELLDFLRFLKAKKKEQPLETALLSEKVLAKDWLRPEEEEAWKNL